MANMKNAVFTEEQFLRHQDTMNDLLTFANASLGSCIYFEPPIESKEQALHGLRIALDLWEDPSLVEGYISRVKRHRFKHADTEVAERWRHALRGPFYVKNRRGHRAEFLYEGTLFEVWSMERTWDDMIRCVPDVVYTTLLPFEGRIVSDGFLLNHESSPCGPGAKRLQREHAQAARRGLVKGADEFCEVADHLNAMRKCGLMEVNNAAVFMDYVAQVNELCNDRCFPYEILQCEIPPVLRGRDGGTVPISIRR